MCVALGTRQGRRLGFIHSSLLVMGKKQTGKQATKLLSENTVERVERAKKAGRLGSGQEELT